MFPESITTQITIYSYFKDFVTGLVTMKKSVLDGVFWNPNSISIFTATGQQTPTNVDVFIPDDANITGKTYMLPGEWYKLSLNEIDEFYTIDLGQANFTRLVKGEPEFEFAIGTPQQLSQQLANFSNPNSIDFVHGAFSPRDVNVQSWPGAESFIRVRV